jgi:uncharacterized protein (DUF885 family)
MCKWFALAGLASLIVGCTGKSGNDISKLSDDFVYTILTFSPSTATAAGLHEYKGQKLDDKLDDVSPEAIDRQRKFYLQFRERLMNLKSEALGAQDKADLAILQSQIALALQDLDEIHTWQHSPTSYVETLGNALFSPYVLEYAPKPERFRSIIARLQQVPLFLDQASSNLVSSPDIWTKVAMDENQGNIDLVDKTLRAAVPDELRENYGRTSRLALDAMEKFQEYLKNNLSARSNADWRLGQERYVKKFRYTLSTGMDAETVLASAESDLTRVRANMLELALPLHRNLFPGHRDHSDLAGDERQNKIIGEVLDKIAERHSTPESYMEDARKDLEEARGFVQQKHLLTLPSRSNLSVIPTPEFMRGIYSVGGFSPAPTLEPQLGAFYWVTPIPPAWPKERAESKLREYNFYKLKLLTIHEAIPGHYVQGEYANDVQPKSRRVLRSIFGNGPYVEGWAQYATQMMLNEGFLDHSPELALTFAKEELRVLANAIIDVRLHMLNMTEQEALDLMQKRTFQEAEEAAGKIQRAKLSSCQLPMYYVGWRAWGKVRNGYRQAKGGAYQLAQFNDDALKQGAVPLDVLAGLLQ